ncbi:elongation factor P [Spiroplasma eriocheiris]|uniref:Elongation factor P n=1 Tax=Spiroplasma eriocheiris TaxID=315358 RepID=A0A0H3XK51_9MOLU|nr:elongation factor P [Spiroplasma eriocheiris]AHF57803.1 translation elongation factor P [Spiroplasma eriocheiris CCTCC M 207170]AKM54251.1 elongation factor P [Spiroplasma eriocheiris]
MINVNDFKPGVTFQYEGNIYVVIEAQHSKSGRGQAHVKTKAKNLRTGATTSITFTGGDKVEKAMIDKVEMQYLYDDGVNLVFMDSQTYDQVEIPSERLTWEKNFFKEGVTASVTKYEGEVLGVILPDKIDLQVIEAEAAVKGDTSSGAMKKAIVETGWELQVPLFIKEGEIISINTSDGKYAGRA